MNGTKKIFWTFVLGFLHNAKAGMIGDQCDWTGSGLSDVASRGVTPVYLRCREGSLSWQYPRGALRLLFRPPLPASEKDFRVCIRVLRRADPPDIYHQPHNQTYVSERFPARLFVEGVERLLPLYAPDDGDSREVRCFSSRRGRAAVYVEAGADGGPRRLVAALRYEAGPLQRHYDPATAHCRPCTHADMELAFCTSDLVSRGTIVDMKQREDFDTTQLTIKLTKLIRVTGGDGHDPRESSSNKKTDVPTETYYTYDGDNELEDKTYGGRRRKVRSPSLHANVHVSADCGAWTGKGEFLVMARRKLGMLTLVCAPRVDEWEKLVEARIADGSAHCLLKY